MEIKIEHPVVRGKLLFHKTTVDGIVMPNPIPIPFGSIAHAHSHEFFVKMSNGVIESLEARFGDEIVQILPSYKKTVQLKTEIGTVKLIIWEVISDIDKTRACNIISRSHYLSSPSKGLFLACKFEDIQEEKKIRKIATKNNKLDPWSDAWNEKAGLMVGCIVLDFLTYGIPRGRMNIARDMGREIDYAQLRKMKRDEVRKQLAVAWISRVAIDAPYRNIGLGSVLANEIGIVANQKMVPKSTYLEIFTTLPTADANVILQEPKRSFLQKVEYNLFDETLSSRQLILPDSSGERTVVKPAKKLYFYRKAVIE